MVASYILVSPFCCWNEHLTFEAGILELIYTLHWREIIFIGEKNHIKNLKTITPQLPIIYYSFLYHNRLFLWFQVVLFTFFFRFFHRTKKIIFLSFEHPNIVFLISAFFTNSIWFLHTYWWKNRWTALIKKIGYRFFITRNKCVVLWEWIFKKMPPSKNNFYIHHPVPSFTSNFRTKKKKNQVVIFPAHKHRQINIEISSNITHKIQSWGWKVVTLWWSQRTLNIDDYFSQLSESQFCIFLSSAGDYSLRCSGSLFDSIGVGTFIFGTQSPMSSSLLEDFRELGIFFPDISSLTNYFKSKPFSIRSIRKNIPEEIFSKNIRLLRKFIS